MSFKAQYILPIWSATTRVSVLCVGLSLLFTSVMAQSGVPRDEMVYTVVEKPPELSGGLPALWDYLRTNVKYPEAAQKAGIKGRVFVSLIVWKDGRVTDINVLRGLGSGCDEEAIRVINAMPCWTPGSQDGRPLNVKYNIPVSFGVPYPKPRK